MQRRHCRHPHEWHLLNFRAQHHSCDQLQWSDLLKRQVPDKPWGFTINVNKRFCEILDQINVFFRFSIVSWSTFFVYGRCYRRSPAHNRLSHILEKNEVPDTLNGFLVKYEDATIIIPDSTLVCQAWFSSINSVKMKMNTTATSQSQVNLWECSASSGMLTTSASAVQLLLNFSECEHISARSDLNIERHVQDWNVLLLDNVCISRNLRRYFMILVQHDDADNICFFCYCLTTYVSFIFSAVDNNADIVEQNWSTDDWHHIYITLDLR